MKIILKVLDFLNLLDYSGERLSITNIALVALIAKLSLSSNVDWPSIVAVITAFGNYASKRHINAQAGQADTGSSDTSS